MSPRKRSCACAHSSCGCSRDAACTIDCDDPPADTSECPALDQQRSSKRQRRMSDASLHSTIPTSPSDNTPYTSPSAPPSAADILQQAKANLRQPGNHLGGEPLGRARHFMQIESKLRSAVSNCQSTSIYISGLPGSGKSFTVRCVLSLLSSNPPSSQPVVIWVNCMSAPRSADVFSHILSLHASAIHKKGSSPASWQSSVPTSSDATCSSERTQLLDQLKTLACKASKLSKPTRKSPPSNRPIVLVLDEIDSLLSSGVEDVCELMMLPHLPGSRVSVIGISNSIDLTERCMPELKCRGCQPALLPFETYSSAQMVDILRSLLQPVAQSVLFEETALQLCTRKVSSVSGDIRKAIKICCAALDIANDALPPQPPCAVSHSTTNQSVPHPPHRSPATPARVGTASPTRASTSTRSTSSSSPSSRSPHARSRAKAALPSHTLAVSPTNPPPTTPSSSTPLAAPTPMIRVTTKDILAAFAACSSSGNSANGAQTTIKSLPLHQQLLLCAAASLSANPHSLSPPQDDSSRPPVPSSAKARGARAKTRAPLTPLTSNTQPAPASSKFQAGCFASLAPVYFQLTQMYKQYSEICRKVHSKPMALEGVAVACEMLTQMSLLQMQSKGGKGKGRSSFGKVAVQEPGFALKVGIKDMEMAFKENVMLRTALSP